MTDQEQDQAQGENMEERINATIQQDDTAEEPTPSSESTAEEYQEAQPDTEEADEYQNDVSEEEALANAKNPERTRQYIEKLKRQAQANQNQNMFDQFRPPSAHDYQNLDQAQVNDIASQYADEDGNIDVDRLNQALHQANQAAQSSQQAIDRITRYEESRQLQEAYSVHPELDPESKKFDPVFYDLVSKHIMVENYAKKGSLTVKQAADYVDSFYKRPTNTAQQKKAAVAEYKQAQENRRQGPIEQGKGQNRVETSDLSQLRQRSRSGDDAATAERLSKLGI